MNKMIHAALAAVALAVFVSTVSAAGVAAADPVDLRIGWAQVPTQITPLVAALMKAHPELFPNQGKTYVYDPVRFQGSPPQITALAANQLDVAAFGPSALALAVTNAHLDVKMVADIAQDGATTGYYSTWWAVKKDGPIKSVADLKGHTALVNAKGATTDMNLRTITRRSGVADKDFNEIEGDFANMLAMLESGKADTAPVMVQFSHDFLATGHYRPLFTTGDVVGGGDELLFWAVKADFIAAHRAALVDMLTDHMKAVRWFLDPKNRDEAMAITVAFTKQSPESLAFVFTKDDVYRSPDLVPVVPPVQKDIDQAVEMTLLPARIDVAPRYVDLTMIEDAKARPDKH